MVENSGISLYADGKSETHVAYMAEFQIDRAVPISYGLLVLPIKQNPMEVSEHHDSKFIYALTHPAKQVSRVWIKVGNGSCSIWRLWFYNVVSQLKLMDGCHFYTDFTEFDSSNEKLMGCENDICAFWDTFGQSGFSVKRIIRAKKEDMIAGMNTLNGSEYYSNLEPSASPFTPAGGSSLYSPIGSHPQKSNSVKLNRCVSVTYY